MIVHYLAAGLIVSALVWHFAVGGRRTSVRRLVAEREKGTNSFSDSALNAIWFSVIGFSATSAIMLLLPSVPTWTETTIGALFFAFGIFHFLIKRGKELGGYFAVVVGILILAGSLA